MRQRIGKSTGSLAFAAIVIAVSGSPVAAAPGEPDQSTGDKAKAAATQPLSDVNLKKQEIPPELERIMAAPYSLEGLKTCGKLSAAIEELNGVLGPDVDVAVVEDKDKKRRDAVIDVAGGVLSGLILPVRGVVREVTGSAESERRYRLAIYTGAVRRAFLKGVGQTKGCKMPAAVVAEAVN